MTGPNVQLPKDGTATPDDWRKWIEAIEARYADVGIILAIALDAILGADTLHSILSALSSFAGSISVVGHSNGAAALFTYFDMALLGKYSDDAFISSFVALDAPTSSNGLVRAAEDVWSAGDPVLVWAQAAIYVKSHGVRGMYAYDTNDALSGDMPGPWEVAATDQTDGDWWNPSTYFYNAHVFLLHNPASEFFDFV